MSPLEQMRQCVAQHGRDGADAWLSQALDMIDPNALGGVRVSLARCARKVGDAAVSSATFPGWTARDAARGALVLRAFEVSDGAADAYGQWLRRGEQGEQESLLRVLPWLPRPAQVLQHAVEACRTNSEVVFRAAALHNPFPAEHFPDLNFNQMVLKALFLGVPVGEIEGLRGRITHELLRMADDYATERRAAGRSVPEDIGLLHKLFGETES